MFANFKKLFHGSSTYSTQSINNFKYKVIMNKSAFIRFGIFVTAFRCLLAFTAIVKIILAMYVKNRLISPIREWLSDVIFYSIFTPFLVLSVTVVESMDYTKKNVRSFKKIALTEQNVKLKPYIMISAIEAIILICYCIHLQYTLQTVSTEVKTILHNGLNKYLTNTAWRTFWNRFQQHYHCCGSSQSTNWFQTAWVSPIVPPFSLVKNYIQENGKFIIPAAPITCCLPETTCCTFTDCEQPDPKKYYQKGCYSIIVNSINSISSTRYLFYVVIIVQIITAVVKYEGYVDNNDNQKTKL